jgi:hypothetical protein
VPGVNPFGIFRFNHSEHREGTVYTAFSIGLVNPFGIFRFNHSEHREGTAYTAFLLR